MTRFRVAPIPILFATWPGRMNWRSFHANSSYDLLSARYDQQLSGITYPFAMDVDVVPPHISYEILRSLPLKK